MKYNRNNKLRLFEICAGYGSQALALRRLRELYPDFDYELVGYAEYDPESEQEIDKQPAVIAHNALHPETIGKNWGDITTIMWNELPDFDFLTYSTPCFVAGTLVLTSDGYKPIEDISLNDSVLTHTNKYQKVLKTGSKTYKDDLYEINAMSFHRIYCTKEHPFYVRQRYRFGHNSVRAFRDPEWIKAQDLTKDHYLGLAINQQSVIPQWNGSIDNRCGHNKPVNRLKEVLGLTDFWYLMGRYIGDGWRRYDKLHKCIVIACSERNEKSLQNILDALGWNYTLTEERTCKKITIYSRELSEFCARYGEKAYGKRIDGETLNLPVQFLERFIEGYIDSDGCYDKKEHHWHITTTSRQLAIGFVQCVAKVYNAPCKVNLCRMPEKTLIEGREVNQRDFYVIRFKKDVCKQDKAFYENGYIWFPITNITHSVKRVSVYNLEVENDNSYTANGAIVHNCQSISQAGLQHGFTEGSGTRSSIIWNVRDCVKAKRPKFLMLENVRAMVSAKFVGLFNLWQKELEDLGYVNFAQVLNAKDYGVPQNRERIFLISILRTEDDPNPKYFFPKPVPLEKCLADVLEEDVDESFFLSDEMLARFCEKSLEEENGVVEETGQDADGEIDFEDFFVAQ